jgi:hypothetical protein
MERLVQCGKDPFDMVMCHAHHRKGDTGRVTVHRLVVALGSASKWIRILVVQFLVTRRISSGLVERMIASPPHGIAERCRSFGLLNPPLESSIIRARPTLQPAHAPIDIDAPARSTDAWSLTRVGSLDIDIQNITQDINLTTMGDIEVFDLHVKMPCRPTRPGSGETRLPSSVESASIALQRCGGRTWLAPTAIVRGQRVRSFALFIPDGCALPTLAMPALTSLLVVGAAPSLVGIQAHTGLRTLALTRVSSLCVVDSLDVIARLRSLSSLYIQITSELAYAIFVDRVLPSLAGLDSLDVLTPAQPSTQSLCACALISTLTRLCLLRAPSASRYEIWNDERPYLHERATTAALLGSPRLSTLGLCGVIRLTWCTAAITDLSLDDTEVLVTDTEQLRLKAPTSLACLGIGSMPALRVLSLRNQCITSLGRVPCTPFLTKLTLRRCRHLVDITAICEMTALVELTVRSCRIDRLPSLRTLWRLDSLTIDYPHTHLYNHDFPQSLTRLRLHSKRLLEERDDSELVRTAATLTRMCDLTVVYKDATWSMARP